MKKVIETSFLLPLLFFLFSCAESDSDPSEVGIHNSQPRYDLIKADSIGIELCDSNYVFGTIIDATFLIDGRIALLDMNRKKVLVYSEDGDFISQAGSGGSGPGEFLLPFTITALSDGGFAVSDIHAGKIVFFDSTCSFVRDLGGFYPMAPMSIGRGANGSIIGKRINYYYDEEEERVLSGSEYCVWSYSTEPDLVYFENYSDHQSEDRISYNYTSTFDGRLFCCPSSIDEYAIAGYTAAGDTSFTNEIPWEVTHMTSEEIDAARPGIVVPGPGTESTSSELTADWEPDSIRNAGLLIGVDEYNRLWVKSGRGETASPVFDLYTIEDGSPITSIETTLPAIARYWNIEVTESGILGWDHNPADYPRVYILELVDRNQQ